VEEGICGKIARKGGSAKLIRKIPKREVQGSTWVLEIQIEGPRSSGKGGLEGYGDFALGEELSTPKRPAAGLRESGLPDGEETTYVNWRGKDICSTTRRSLSVVRTNREISKPNRQRDFQKTLSAWSSTGKIKKVLTAGT